jgi:hypothetical protein
LIVKGILHKNRILYYCVACNNFFEADDEGSCEHFIDFDIEEIDEDEFEYIIELNYEVKILNEQS